MNYTIFIAYTQNTNLITAVTMRCNVSIYNWDAIQEPCYLGCSFGDVLPFFIFFSINDKICEWRRKLERKKMQ